MEKIKSDMTPRETKQLVRKILARFSLTPVIIGCLTLWPAGTFNYWQVYVYTAVLIVPMIFVLLYFIRKDPRFLERRMKSKEKETAQKWIVLGFSLFFLAGFIVSGLDKRYGWSDVPVYIVIAADLVVFLSYMIIFLVFRQNSYASRTVDVEENQELISTGLYGIVRHPMYVGVLMMYMLTPLALGSFWGLIPMVAIPLALIQRILNEEKVLRRDLPGYTAYCSQTRYRLIPFIW